MNWRKKKPLGEVMRDLNDNTRFQLVGRVAMIFGTPLLLAAGVWSLTLLSGMSQDVAVMKSQLTTLANDPYRGGDAKRDFALRDSMIAGNGKTIDALSLRVGALELEAARRK